MSSTAEEMESGQRVLPSRGNRNHSVCLWQHLVGTNFNISNCFICIKTRGGRTTGTPNAANAYENGKLGNGEQIETKTKARDEHGGGDERKWEMVRMANGISHNVRRLRVQMSIIIKRGDKAIYFSHIPFSI